MLKLPQKIKYVIGTLEKNGYSAYIVGGCVRDMLLKSVPNDYDVTTSASPLEVQKIFPKTVPTGIKHGTVTVIIENEPIEVTTFRTESSYSDSRRPDKVEFITDLKSDLSRRDFTVNAMAFSPKEGLKDYFNGIADLENKILRAVGEPDERFEEDALRILRLFRFASQLGFIPEEQTLKSALLKKKGLENISRERIFTELYKTALGSNPQAVIPLIEAGGLGFLGIKGCPDFDALQKCGKNSDLKFFMFLYSSKADVFEVLNELKTSNALKNYAEHLIKLINFGKPKSKSDIKEMLNLTSPEIFSDYLIISEINDKEKIKREFEEILKNKEPYRISDLKIDGKALKESGFSGAKIGEILENLRKFVIDNPQKNNKNDLIQFVKSVF